MANFEGTKINGIADINNVLPKNSSYLFFEDSPGERYVFPTPSIPSQYMRKVVAESIGKACWDWRQSGYEPELVATTQHLSAALAENITRSER